MYGGNTTYTDNANQLDTYFRGRNIYIQASGSGGSGSQKNIASFSSDYMDLHGNLSVDGTINSKDNITAAGFYESSDKRLKENISDIKDHKNIEFKQFNFKSDEDKNTKYGVIAQELEKLGLTNLISENSDGIKSVDYISLLCMVVDNLQKKVAKLEAKLKN